MRRFFINDAKVDDEGSMILRGSDAHHLRDVLRLKPGDMIVIFDGKGFECEANVDTIFPDRVKVKPVRRLPNANESPLRITLAQGMLKDRKMDDLVRQVTELGICRWAPFIAERSVSRPGGARIETRMRRWETISREAVKQCRRNRVADIRGPLSFEQMLDLSEEAELKILFWEKAGSPLRPSQVLADVNPPPLHAVVVLGPEGGLTDEEVARAESRGFFAASLGPRILKADTATVAACAIVQYLFGDLGQKNLDKAQGL